MKGKILGYNPAESGGVITGEDGKRYKFVLGEWKAPRVPKAGEEVDYEISAQGMAAEIYPLRASAGIDLGDMGAKMKGALGSGNVDLGDVGSKAKQMFASGSSSPAGEHAMTLVRTRLGVPLALILLIASFALSFITWQGANLVTGGPLGSHSYSLLSVSDFADNVGTTMANVKKAATAEYNPTNISPANIKLANARDDAGITGSMLNLLYLLYLVPLGAVFILWREWQGRPMALVSLAVGVISIAGFGLAYLAKFSVNATIKEYMGDMVSQMAEVTGTHVGVHTAFGAWVFLICGALLVLNALGIVRLSGRTA